MKISNPKKLLLFALIILASNSIIGYVIFESYQKQLQSAKLVQHTEQTIYQTTALLTLARDMVTSTQAFAMTRDNFFLESIDTVEKTTVEHLQQLTILSEGYHPEQQLADGVQRTMQELGLLCRHLVAQSTVEKVSAPIVPASVYELPALKAIQDEEANLLKQRIITHNLLLAQFNRFSLVMFILMIFFTVLLVAVTWNYLNQHKDKNQWAGELIVANEELAHQDKEKEMRAAELIIANHELAFQNDEKEKRAAELIVANQELAFQNDEKEKRAAELIVANRELAFQNDEKEKRASELLLANQELEAFAYVSSHDLQEPLRKIQTFSNRILETEYQNLSERGKDYFGRMQSTASRMQQLIDDLLGFSRLNVAEREFENTALIKIVDEVAYGLKESIDEKQAVIETGELGSAVVIPFQFRQLMHNLISNALKFSNPRLIPHIKIESTLTDNTTILDKTLSGIRYHQISVCDNGIGFNLLYKDRIFEVFQKLHGKHEYPGTGIGLAIVKKIVENHNGHITVTSKLDMGTTFNIYIPCFPVEDFPALQAISTIA